MDPRLPLAAVPAYARRVEAMGYDGLQVSETIHDALAVAVLVAEHTHRLTIRTSVVVAFVRSPTLTAYAAWDLARLSGGRFELGLGTQVRQNVEDRFGVPWTSPVERMRDYVEALGALYASYRSGQPVRHEGAHYRLTRLQPYFNPGPDDETAPPATWLGGVNAGICRLAGELAAGFVTHPTSSDPRYLEEICLPNLRAGAASAGRDPADVEVVAGTAVVTGASAADVAAGRERQRRLLAFLFSTPAYRRTLELYGWEELAGRLRAMIRADRWSELAGLLPDEVLETVVPVARHEELAERLLSRYGHLVDAVTLAPPDDPAHDRRLGEVIAALQAA
jgi:probable F420-dependent oxidoreductase